MLNKVLALTYLLNVNIVITRSQEYSIHVFNENFKAIENYTSYCNEKALNMMNTENPFLLNGEFDLGFKFPYFQFEYNALLLEADAVVDFKPSPTEDSYPMYLFSTDTYYAREVFDPTQKLDSDIRYKVDTINSLKVFIMEFHKVYIGNYENTEVTFQQRFWENGDVDVAFGDLNIPEDIFKPGHGIKYIDGNIIKYFPAIIALVSPEEDKFYQIGGNLNDNPTKGEYDQFVSTLGLNYLPTKNTVCRFKRNPSSTNTPENLENQFYIGGHFLTLPSNSKPTNVRVYNINGLLVKTGDYSNIDLSDIYPGIYIIQVNTMNNRNYSFKIFKN